MGILNKAQIKSLNRMVKYISEMSEATTDLYNDCAKISANKPKGSKESEAAQELTANFQVANFLFGKVKENLNQILSKENENENDV
ncbi:MAG: hypothetical protein ACI4RM_04935 [Ruminococcus sp.]